MPRLARVAAGAHTAGKLAGELCIIQDASVRDPETRNSPAESLIAELRHFVFSGSNDILLACINRGILDEALLRVSDDSTGIRGLLERIISAASVSPTPARCWPLEGAETVAVWPMDVESLITVPAGPILDSPAGQLFRYATDSSKWPEANQCPAGKLCPFCVSRALLGDDRSLESVLRILRWHELAVGKRWTFRDLLSLASYLLATAPHEGRDDASSPCSWAAAAYERWSTARTSSSQSNEVLATPFLLAAAQYQHALFGSWLKPNVRALKEAVKKLGLEREPALRGFIHFLTSTRARAIPSTLIPLLADLNESLDPALADPVSAYEKASGDAIPFERFDVSFSQSVGEGYELARHYLTPIEREAIDWLRQAESEVIKADQRLRCTAHSRMLLGLMRDYACRLVRRSLGVRQVLVRDAADLGSFERLLGGDADLLYRVRKDLERQLNDRERFQVSLNTTFGEPLPPPNRRATLTTAKQTVEAPDVPTDGRPSAPVRFLFVGTREKAQPIPLTYELFRFVRAVGEGLNDASLSRAVMASLDMARAHLAGRLVRDPRALDDAIIRLGTRDQFIAIQNSRFVVTDAEVAR